MAELFTEWYLTQGSGASNTNGGTMNTGNGQSYANDGPYLTKTNCSSSVDGAFVTNDNEDGWGNTAEGDAICFDTAGSKEISIITAVTGNVLTLTGGFGVTPSQSGKTVTVGGAWATPAFATGELTTSHKNVSGYAVRLNIKYESGVAYAVNDLATPAGFSEASPLTIEGYVSTPGDIDPWTVETRVLLESTAASAYAVNNNHNFVNWRNMNFVYNGASARQALHMDGGGDYSTFLNCRFNSNTSVGINCDSAYVCYYIVMDRCVIEDCAGAATDGRLGADSRIVNCLIANNGGIGVFPPGGGVLQNNVIIGNTGDGIANSGGIFGQVFINHNTIADNGGDGLDMGASVDLANSLVTNNIFAYNGGWGVIGTSAARRSLFLLSHNAFYGNTSGTHSQTNVNYADRHNITNSEPFTETTQATRKSNVDYGITADMKAVGFPGEFPANGAYNTGYADLGAHQAVAGGGTTYYGISAARLIGGM